MVQFDPADCGEASHRMKVPLVITEGENAGGRSLPKGTRGRVRRNWRGAT